MSNIDPVHLKIGIVGIGVMGSGIAQSLSLAGVSSVVCVDVTDDALERARTTIERGRYGINSAVERGLVTGEVAQRAIASIAYSTDRSSIHDSDVVIEAVFEDLALKIRLFRELDRDVDGRAVLASNTSGFPICALAAATDRPGQVVGWHWASPAPVQRMAEIVRTPETNPATVELVKSLAERCGKNPVVINDTMMDWGFVANRVFGAARREAQRVVSEGITDEAGVDQLMKDCFRWPAGPFELTGGARSNWSER